MDSVKGKEAEEAEGHEGSHPPPSSKSQVDGGGSQKQEEA